jgi:hypothetical protein
MRSNLIWQIASIAYGRVSSAYRRQGTMRHLDSLPDYIHRDIGWNTGSGHPDAFSMIR